MRVIFKTKIQYYEELLKIINLYGIKIKSEIKTDDDIKILLTDDDFNELIINIKETDNKAVLNVNDKRSVIYHKIAKNLIELDDKLTKYENYIGTDESGKGDYLGPLVVAGFISNRNVDIELLSLGVKDSKHLTDKNVIKLDRQIKKLYSDRFSIFSLEPEAYNLKYSNLKLEGKNLTSLLGWSHSTVINTLLNNDKKIDALIIDKIQNIEYIKEILNTKNLAVEILNIANAEENVAVAASSILARAEYLKWLNGKSKETEIQLYKGANDMVFISAVEVMKKYGKESINKYAKLHFKSTQKVVELYKNER